MRNLLDRLKPEYKAKLKQLESTYPATIEEIYSNLTKFNFYTELRFGTAAVLCSLLDVTLSNFLDLFDEE